MIVVTSLLSVIQKIASTVLSRKYPPSPLEFKTNMYSPQIPPFALDTQRHAFQTDVLKMYDHFIQGRPVSSSTSVQGQ